MKSNAVLLVGLFVLAPLGCADSKINQAEADAAATVVSDDCPERLEKCRTTVGSSLEATRKMMELRGECPAKSGFGMVSVKALTKQTKDLPTECAPALRTCLLIRHEVQELSRVAAGDLKNCPP
ncbi:MAG: hypothetical protein WC641_01575 [Patescibacteria group bacterium]